MVETMDNIKLKQRKKVVFSLINLVDFLENKQIIKSNKRDLSKEYYSLLNYYLELFLEGNSLYRLFKENKFLSSGLMTSKEVESCLDAIKKHFFFGNKIDYRYLLILEILYLIELFGNPVIDDFYRSLILKLGFKESQVSIIINQIKNPDLIKDERIIASLSNFKAFKAQQSDYNKLKVYNIAVCATMSAGKSTFVNALLGWDVLPARNEATTAKITSVYDKDCAENMIGYVVKNGEIAEQSANVTLEILDKWNSSNIERIYLQGDLDGIKNNGFVVAVHDTPGTNNSGDKSHYDVTMEFLQNNKMDTLVFVANATQLCTTDERILLSELLNKVIRLSNLPVIFILNKVDELDEEKENISDIQKRYCKYLEEIGFKEPKIFLMSAMAARLLKMVKNGRAENLTAREKRELRFVEALFGDFEKTGLPNVERYIEELLRGR